MEESEPGAAEHVEVEWQFDALDLRPVERWLAALPAHTLATVAEPTGSPEGTARGAEPESPGQVAPDMPALLTVLAKPSRRLVDHYLDTEDWRIARAGYVLRTRRRGRHDEATLKSLKPATAQGLRSRLEITEPLEGDGPSRLDSAGPVGARVRAMAGRRPLLPVFEVRTRRRPFSVRLGAHEVAEVALDDTTIVGGDQHPVRLQRVEAEIDPDYAGLLEPAIDDLVRSCGLRPALLSKFEAGLLGLGLELPGAPDLGPTRVAPAATMAEVAFAVSRRHVGQLLAREPGTRLGEDPEELHDMRVATRRLRAALELFAGVLPVRAQQARAELGWIGSVLGAVRDLDVQLERHDNDRHEVEALLGHGAANSLDPLRERLVTEREAARGVLLAALDSTRYQQLLAGLTSLVQSGSPRRVPLSRVPAVVEIPELVEQRHRAARKAARRARRSGQPTDFHRLRKRCKRLRYCLEFTRDLYGGRTDSFVRQLTRLQDALGRLQDDEVAADRLHQLATGGDPMPPETIFAMGATAAHYRSDAHRLLRRAAKRLSVLTGDEWSSLAKVMQRRRHEALATRPLGRPAGLRSRTGVGAHGTALAAAPTPAPEDDKQDGAMLAEVQESPGSEPVCPVVADDEVGVQMASAQPGAANSAPPGEIDLSLDGISPLEEDSQGAR